LAYTWSTRRNIAIDQDPHEHADEDDLENRITVSNSTPVARRQEMNLLEEAIDDAGKIFRALSDSWSRYRRGATPWESYWQRRRIEDPFKVGLIIDWWTSVRVNTISACIYIFQLNYNIAYILHCAKYVKNGKKRLTTKKI
jgi:hypothetical protein